MIWAIDPSNGKELWSLSFRHLGYNTFVDWNGTLIVSNHKSLYAVSNIGKIQATRDRTPGIQYPSALATSRDYLVQAYGGIVRCYFKTVEKQVWKNSLRGLGVSHGMSLCIFDEMFVIIGMRGTVACLTIEKGKTLWTKSLSGTVAGVVTLQLFQNNILALCDGFICCLDPSAKGKELWSMRIGGNMTEPGEIASVAQSTDCNQHLLSQHIDFQQRNGLVV